MEYAEHGNLRDFLRERRPSRYSTSAIALQSNYEMRQLKLKDLVSFSYQVSRGMDYLSSIKVRD